MKKAFSIIGLISGIAIICLGLYIAFSLSNSYNGDTAEYASFGADFYTYEYKATKIAASNVKSLGEYLEKIVSIAGYFIAVMGVATSCYFGCKLGEKQETQSNNQYMSNNRTWMQTSSNNESQHSENSIGTWVCSKCGESNSGKDLYCRSCGEYK